jgi:hypothetical protein
MTVLKDAKKIGPTFSNSMEIVRARYDFAVDGGALGAKDIFEADADVIITHFSLTVKDAVTSTGNLTLAVGVTGATTAFCTATQGAKANLIEGAVIVPVGVGDDPTVMPLPRKLAKGQKVLQTIGTEVANAGMVEYCIGYVRA